MWVWKTSPRNSFNLSSLLSACSQNFRSTKWYRNFIGIQRRTGLELSGNRRLLCKMCNISDSGVKDVRISTWYVCSDSKEEIPFDYILYRVSPSSLFSSHSGVFSILWTSLAFPYCGAEAFVSAVPSAWNIFSFSFCGVDSYSFSKLCLVSQTGSGQVLLLWALTYSCTSP